VTGWRSLAYAAARPLLFRFDSERIHRLSLDGLRIAGESRFGRPALILAGGVPRRRGPWAELLATRFRNRIGLAAGFDKNGVALRGWAALGFGFVEIGTVTPQPQAGNARPRLFRLVADEALVNRMGFNNAGAAAAARNVMLARRHLPTRFAVGINIGRGRRTPDERVLDDYLAAYRVAAPVADYVVVNVSSPNTPGLRELQDPNRLAELLAVLAAAGERLRTAAPLLVKLAPELRERGELERLIEGIARGPASGVVLSNTTLSRPATLLSSEAGEAGGLSGRPLLERMLEAVDCARQVAGDRLTIIASGGIDRAADVAAAYASGADLVQLWTGLIYRGPGLIGEAVRVPFRGRSPGW
jgi:dihydroorotate dehydrogenase